MSGTAALGGVLERITARYLAEGFFRGAVIRVERAGEDHEGSAGGAAGESGGAGAGGTPLFEGAWGHALFTERARIPMTSAHLFDVASLSKVFTATAVLRLVTQGKLRLDSKVAPLLGFDRDNLSEALGRVDLQSLLTHSSGIQAWFPFYTRRGEPFDSVLAGLLAEHPPRGEVIYSDLNFMLLGKVIEAVSGRPLEAAMDEIVFTPLGLRRSSYRTREAGVVATEFGNRIEMGMVRELGLAFDGWRSVEEPIQGACNDGNGFYYFDGVAGHAGIFSDARDLCALGRLYLEGGRAGGTVGGSGGGSAAGRPYLDPTLAAAAGRDHGGGRGLGFQLGVIYPGDGFGHTGFTGTYLHMNRAAGLVMVVLTNRLHVADPRSVTDYFRDVSEATLDAGRG